MKHAFKKIMAFVLVLAMIVGVVPAVFAANVGPFTDVDDSSWYAPYVDFVYDNGLMSGMTSTTFEPNEYLTRAQTVAVIHRLAGSPEVSEPASFTDLPKGWYKTAIAWAEDEEITAGIGGGKFNPEGLVTREQMVSLLWRYYDCPEVSGNYLADYPDADKVSDYAVKAMNWVLSNNVLSGIPHGSVNYLEPQSYATRAQYAKIIAVLAGFVLPVDEAVILFTNDVHTYINKSLSYDSVAAMKNETASSAAGVLLVDAGDHVQGTAYGSMDDGETIIELMNAAGYDLATLGNHEFDYGMARALELVSMADFPYVSANFYHEKDGVRGENVLDSYKIFEVGGYTIAFVGITTPETFTKSTPAYFMNEAGEYIYGIAGGDDGAALYADVQKAIDAAKAENVDFVIALGHCGDDPASQPWTSEEVIANTTGLDAFIDGHSHSTVEEKKVLDKDGRPVVLTQTGEYFNAIGKMTVSSYGISVDLITEYNGYDPNVKEIKDAWIAEVDTLLGEKIADNQVDFKIYDTDGTRLIRKQETNLGDFTADALYYLFGVTEGLKVDAAIMNGGGIRADMKVGDVTYKTTKNVHTFGNVACLITVTGQQILDALEWGAKNVGVGESGGFLQVSGITYEIHSYIESTVQADDKGVWIGGPTGEYRVKNVTIGGEPLDVNATYNLAGYNYTLRDLGDGFAMFDGAVNVKDYVMEDYLVLANYAKSFPVENGIATIKGDNSVLGADYSSIYGEGRITIVTEDPGPDVGDICSPHEYTEERVEPTCVTPGYVIYTCTKCGDSYKEILEATGVHEDKDRNGECDHCGTAVEVKVEPEDLIGKYFEKVTEDQTDWTGVYLIVVEDVSIEDATTDVAFDGSLGSLDECFNYVEAVVEDNKVLADEKTSAAFFEILKVDGGYTVRSASGQYIGPKESGNGLVGTSDAAEAYVNTISMNEDGTVNISSSDGRNLRFNSATAQRRFRYFKSAQNSIYLYKINVDIPGYEPEEPADTEYVLTNELKAGDKVIIVNADSSKALSSEVINNYYKAGVDVVPADNKVVTSDTSIVWTVVADGTGFNLVNDEGSKLSIDGTYNSIPYDKGNDAWSAAAAATENCVYVINENGKYLQWSSYGNFSVYTYSVDNEATFAMQLYTLSTGEEPEPVPDNGTYVLTSELKDGDKVVIYNGGNAKALSSTVSGYYIAGVDATVEDNKIVTSDTTIVWNVTVNADGSYTFTQAGDVVLGMEPSGNFFNLKVAAGEGVDTAFVLDTCNAETSTYYVRSNSLTGQYGNVWLEWYAKKGAFSAYCTGNDRLTENDFGFQFYALSETAADEIVIYYTNDVHTYIDKTLSYANIADLKTQTAANGTPVFLLDAGDHIQGTAYGSMDKGETIIKLMNAAGYDLATLGNHEFDYGMERALSVIKQANFPYVSANFYHEENGVVGDNVLDAYVILEANGTKIAVIGITTPESFTKSTPAYFQDENGNYIYGIAGGEDGSALYTTVQKAIDAAKAEGVDYVIALGHLGDDLASRPWTSEELIANTTGLDAFIDGHSHSTVEGKEVTDKAGNTVLLTQTGEYFNAIGKMTITADGIKTELITEWTGADENVKAIADAWISEINTKLGEVIGSTELTFDNYDADGNRMVRKYETNTGDFAADALYYLFDNMGMNVDFAIMNGGGIRNKAVTGDISYLTCKNIHTFGNVACLITVTGQQIKDALEWGSRQTPVAEVGGFLHTSGLTYKVNGNIESTVQQDEKGVWIGGPTGEYRVYDIKVYNKETNSWDDLDVNKTYNLAGYNYTLRDLGDGFAMFDGAVNVLDYVMEDYMVLANYVRGFEKGVVGATNSPLLTKYENFKLDYSSVEGIGRIVVDYTAEEAWDGVITIGGLTPNIWTTKYGNIYTDCTAEHFTEDLGLSYGDLVTVKFLDQELILPVIPTFSYVDSKKPALLLNKNEQGNPTGYAYLAINMGDFTTTYGIATKGTDEDGNWYWTACEGVEFPIIVTFELYEKEGYMAEYLLHELTRTNNRADYADLTDEQFANFRAITTTGMGEGVLYRSSSPINPELGRNTYADTAAKTAGVKTFINLADNEEEAKAYEGFADTYYSTQNVIYLCLGVDVTGTEFGTGLATGLRYIINNDGPYLVHCTEGKDRAGFTSAILECFMGATYAEVVADYMVTYYNYYGVEVGTEKYNAIAESNIIKTLETVFGVEDLSTADLKAEAREYLLGIGLTEDEVSALSVKLGGKTEENGVTYTIHFSNPNAWTNVYAYAWLPGVTDGYLLNAWPGTQIAADAEHSGWYTVEFTADAAAVGLIFNSGSGSQTNDLSVAAADGAKSVEAWVTNMSEVLYTAPESWTNGSAPTTYTYTLHYGNPNAWNSVYVYAWDSANNTLKGTWPGTAISADDNNSGWYTVELSLAETTVNVIFNSGSGSQTADLKVAVPAGESSVEAWITDTVSYTAPEGWVVPATGTTYTVADSVAVGDKIVVVASYNDATYAMVNDGATVSNALNACEVTVSGSNVEIGAQDVVWEVCAGSAEGTFLLKSSDGKYINWTPNTTLKLNETTGADLSITCGSGTSQLLLAATASGKTQRALAFRMNSGVPQFRGYALSNASGEYSQVITIYKAVNG